VLTFNLLLGPEFIQRRSGDLPASLRWQGLQDCKTVPLLKWRLDGYLLTGERDT
jgi:hypothetical protein